jgi:hypothetical protein
MSTPAQFMVLAGGSAAPFTPTAITGLQAWWDFSDVATLWQNAARSTPVAADADPIGGVTDKSGAGNHLAQATAGFRPQYKVGIRAGRSVGRWDGTDDEMAVTFGVGMTAATFFVVAVKRSAPGGTANDLWRRVAGTSEFLTLSSWSATDYVWYKNQAGVQVPLTGATATNWAINGLRHPSAATATGYYNGVPTATFDPDDNLTTAGAFLLGNSGAVGSNYDVGEALIFNTALSTADHNTIGTGLASRWGLSWTTV